MTIPEDVLNKINQIADEVYPKGYTTSGNEFRNDGFKAGASVGYSLASEQLNKVTHKILSLEGQILEKDFEIERLKGLIEKAYDYGVSVVGNFYSPDIYWKGFKEINQL